MAKMWVGRTAGMTDKLADDCIQKGTVPEELPLKVYRGYSDLFEADVYGEISLETCVAKRISEGGTSVASVEAQIKYVKECLEV